MSRLARSAAVVAALGLALAACSEAKDTGLPAGPTKQPANTNLVEAVDSAFEPKSLEVKPGVEVTWEFAGSAPHNVKFVTVAGVDSHPTCATDIAACSKKGDEFKHKFDAAGEFLYYCVIHGTANGQGMAGTIVVKA